MWGRSFRDLRQPATCHRVYLDAQEEHSQQGDGLEAALIFWLSNSLFTCSQEQISKKTWFLLPVQCLKERKWC